jgi:hypothetical protein
MKLMVTVALTLKEQDTVKESHAHIPLLRIGSISLQPSAHIGRPREYFIDYRGPCVLSIL